jgi:hypothetical protein
LKQAVRSIAMAKAKKARRKSAPKKRAARRADTGKNGGPVPSSARKTRGFEEGPAQEVRPDDAEYLH